MINLFHINNYKIDTSQFNSYIMDDSVHKLEKELTDCFVIEDKQITNKTIIDIIN